MANHSAERCVQCGQVDDHPKSHWSTGETYHHDCLPYDKRAELVESHPDAEAIVSAAEGGKRGEELRAHIFQLSEAKGDN